MKRMSANFFAELQGLRAQKGEREYDRDEIRADVIALLKNTASQKFGH